MQLKKLEPNFTVCKVRDLSLVDLSSRYCFLGKTEDEISVVCPEKEAPKETIQREDGWKAFRIEGTLDFSLIGILARISAILAAENIGIFVVSTYNTDYVLTKATDFERAMAALAAAGYDIL